MTNLFETVAKLRELEPAFVSVTYGAGGSTRDRTIAIIGRIKNELGIEAMAHFTCVGSTIEELREVLDAITATGVENIIALRGDPPQGETDVRAHRGRPRQRRRADQADRRQLRRLRRRRLLPGGAPRGRSAPRPTSRYAKQKVENGASFLVTQLFFDNDAYFDYVDRARAAGIDVPIVPGIMPIGGYEQIKRFTSMCGATIPERLMNELDARKDDPEAIAGPRRRLRDAAVRRPAGARRPGNSLLHAEQVAGHAGDSSTLQAARPARPLGPRAALPST